MNGYVSETTYQRLAAQAAARNISVEEMVAPALDQLAEADATEGVSAPPSLEDRQRAFEELTKLVRRQARRYPAGHTIDDDRESIYREREDAQV